MSSVLTKVIVSAAVSLAVKPNNYYCYNMDNKVYSVSSPAFLATYGAMVAYDIYDFFKGDIKTIKTKDEAGNLVEKEYRVIECDFVKYFANAFPVIAAIETPLLDKISGGKPLAPQLVPAFLAGGIILETVADTFNWHPTTTIGHEINGDDFLIIS